MPGTKRKMAAGRVSVCYVIFCAVARLIYLTEQPKLVCNNSKEFYFHLWKLCKVNFSIRPRFIDDKPRVYPTRDFTSPTSYMVGLILLCGDVATQPGPSSGNIRLSPFHCSNIKCLYMNSQTQ